MTIPLGSVLQTISPVTLAPAVDFWADKIGKNADPVSSWVGRSTRGSAPSIGGTVARGLSLGLGIVSAANLIVDGIGRAGAYKWRDNLLDQINGGNSNKDFTPPPVLGGQGLGVLYIVSIEATINISTAFGPFDPQYDYQQIVCSEREVQGPILGLTTSGYGIIVKTGLGDRGFDGWNPRFYRDPRLVNIHRKDGNENTSIDMGGEITGQDNTNPFAVPAIAPYSSPDIYPNSIPVDIGVDPNPVPAIAAIPSPSDTPSPFIPAIPLADPIPYPSPSSIPSPDLSPSLSLSPSSTPSPQPVTIAPPRTDLGKLLEGQRDSRAQTQNFQKEAQSIKDAAAIQSANAKQPIQEAVCEEAQPGKCIDKAIKRNNQSAESVSITVKEFDKCGDDGKPVFKEKSITVLKGAEDYVKNLFEEIADTAGLSCSINVSATFPDSWAGKVPDERPQAVVYYREWNGSKFGLYSCHVSIPYYSKPKGFKPSLPTIKKGSFFGILKLKDNSQIYVNCESIQESKRVVSELRKFTGVEGKGARSKYGEYGDGDLKKVTVKPVRLDFYSKGMANNTPDWSVNLS